MAFVGGSIGRAVSKAISWEHACYILGTGGERMTGSGRGQVGGIEGWHV